MKAVSNTFKAVILLSAFYFFFRGHWGDMWYSVFILLLTFIPAILRAKWKILFPPILECAFTVFVFLTLFLGDLWDLYRIFPWWDMLLHSLSGILLVNVGFLFLRSLNKKNVENFSPATVAMFGLCFSMLVDVMSELYEFGLDGVTGGHSQESGLADTMGDLGLDLVGALIVAIIAYTWMKRHKKMPFTSDRLN